MSKRTTIIIILLAFILILGGLILFYFRSNLAEFSNGKTEKIDTTTDVYDPFGANTNNITASTDGNNIIDTAETTATEKVTEEKLRQIVNEPISGFSAIKNNSADRIDIRYILRATGNIYETYSDSTESKRLSNTTIPKVYEAKWLPTGKGLIIQYLKEGTENIQTFSLKIKLATTTLNESVGSIESSPLPENISDIAINPTGDKIFYLTKNASGSSGFIAKTDGSEKKLIFESPLTEWIVSWPGEKAIALNTKASAEAKGYLYFLNSQTGNLTKILGEINGLTTITNPVMTEVIYSDSVRGIPSLYLYNILKGESKLLPWKTMPEKCSWSKNNSKIIYCAVPESFSRSDYPDSWYQGLISFSDKVWMLNTETEASTLVYDPKEEVGNEFDIINPTLDNEGNFLYFIDKKDYSLWSLLLNS